MALLPLLTGLGLAPAVALFARLSGFDRERGFYPLQLIVFALLYLLFAAIAGGGTLLLAETPGLLLFGAVAVTGFRSSLWLVAAGLFGHGLFDAVHGQLIANPGVPAWWPAFCAGYDISAAACLAVQLRRAQALIFHPARSSA
jgi:hypothetical protein